VAKVLVCLKLFVTIKEYIQERNHLPATCVERVLGRRELFTLIEEHIQERSLLPAMSVE